MLYALAYFLLLNFRSILGSLAIFKFLPNLILLIGVIAYMRPQKGRLYLAPASQSSKIGFFVLFLVLWSISILRTGREGASVVGHMNDLATIFFFPLVLYQYLNVKFRENVNFDEIFTRETLKMLMIPSMVIAGMLGLYAVGYNHPSTTVIRMGEDMVILKALGINMVKKAIPFTPKTHPNSFGIWAGGTFVLNAIAILVLQVSKRIKYLLYFNGLVIFGFLLFADSRGTLFSTGVTGIIVYLTYKFRMAGILRALIVIVPVMPFVFISLMGLISQTSIADKMSRGDKGAQNISTLSSRTTIWDACLEEIKDPKPIHFIGWGEHGQKMSGVSMVYAYMFPEDEWENPELIVTHNFFFQAFFDTGYIGALLIMYVLLAAMNNAIFLYNKGYRAGLIYIAFLVYYVLSGALESTFGNHFRAYTLLFLLLTVYIFTFRSAYDKMVASHGSKG